MESDAVELSDQFSGLVIRNIDEEKVLRHSGAQRTAAKALCKFGGGFELLSSEAAAQDRCTHIAEPGPALWMDADMIAKDLIGNGLGARRQKFELDARLELFKKALGSPAFFHEEVLEACAIAALAQDLLVTKDFS